MPASPSVVRFLGELAALAGRPVLSEAKMDVLAEPDALTVVTEGDDVLAVGVTARHLQGDGTVHHAVETAVRPAMQFVEFERVVVESTLDTVPKRSPASVWSDRSTLDAALEQIGFTKARTLLYLVVDLPLPPGPPGHGMRPFRWDDTPALVRVNNEAFHGHREAGTLTEDRFASLARAPWFDPEGIVVAEDASAVIGFCWTKVHPGGDGEIYRIAVAPTHHGQGWGRSLLEAGYGAISHREDVARGTLWVDASNGAAMRLYEALGMGVDRRIGEWEPPI